MSENLYKQIGEKIQSAREKIGMSQEELARNLGYTSSATISHFEAGQRKVSVADLQQISQILGLPLEYFFENLETTVEMQKFRLRATDLRPSAREPVANFLSFAHKHSQDLIIHSDKLKFLSPGDAADLILQSVGITEPPVSPGQVAKHFNIPVFYWDFPNEVSGIFVTEAGKACIGVNQSHPNVRQRFSIAHELGHMVFGDEKDLYVDFTEVELSYAISDHTKISAETKANWFAADLLMPRKWIENEFRKVGEAGIVFLVQKYEVSEQALWIRLRNLKLIDPQ